MSLNKKTDQKQGQNQGNNQENFEFILNIDQIKDVSFEKYQPDFTFIINEKEYKTSRIVADILSPIIRRYHETDETIDKFYISTNDYESNNKTGDFSSILSLINFEPRQLNKDEQRYYQYIFAKLGNKKEYEKLISINNEEITAENVLTLIESKLKNFQNQEFLDDVNDYVLKEIEYITSHFYEIEEDQILQLPPQIIEEIVKSDKLELEDEDSLLKFVNKVYTRNRQYSFLYSYVNFQYVSQKELENFSSIFDVNDINNEVWHSILSRALNSKIDESEIKNKRRHKSNEKKLEGIPLLLNDQEFNGIIKYLTNQAGGNLHDKGIVDATTDSYCRGEEPKYLLDFTYNNDYNSSPNKKPWICFDFKNKKIKLTHYSIKSNGNNGPNTYNLKSWIIEVSNDGKTWKKIDERKNCQLLNGYRITGTFDVQPKMTFHDMFAFKQQSHLGLMRIFGFTTLNSMAILLNKINFYF